MREAAIVLSGYSAQGIYANYHIKDKVTMSDLGSARACWSLRTPKWWRRSLLSPARPARNHAAAWWRV
jgi:hypothetical protein